MNSILVTIQLAWSEVRSDYVLLALVPARVIVLEELGYRRRPKATGLCRHGS